MLRWSVGSLPAASEGTLGGSMGFLIFLEALQTLLPRTLWPRGKICAFEALWT